MRPTSAARKLLHDELFSPAFLKGAPEAKLKLRARPRRQPRPLQQGRGRPESGSGAMKPRHLPSASPPLLLVVLGGALLMVAEAFSHRTRGGRRPPRRPVVRSRHRHRHHALRRRARRGGRLVRRPREARGPHGSRAPYLVIDRFTLFFTFVLCLGGGLAALLAGGYLPEHRIDRGEFYPLLIFSTVGAIALAGAEDLLSLFLGLETMSARRLLADRLPPRLAPQQRGCGEVLPPRVLRRRAPSLRRRAPLRRHGPHRPPRHPRGPVVGHAAERGGLAARQLRARAHRRGAHARGVALQGRARCRSTCGRPTRTRARPRRRPATWPSQ